MATMTGKRQCDDGQSCGKSCIAKGDNCTAFVTKRMATGLLSAVKSAASEAGKDKIGTAATVAGTALSFAFPLDLMPDSDMVVASVSDTLAYSARAFAQQISKRRAR